MFYDNGTRSLLCALKLKAMELGVDYIHGEVYNMAHETIDDRIFQVFIVFYRFREQVVTPAPIAVGQGWHFLRKILPLKLPLKTLFRHFFTSGASSGIRTLHPRILSGVYYHCAIQPLSFLLFSYTLILYLLLNFLSIFSLPVPGAGIEPSILGL